MKKTKPPTQVRFSNKSRKTTNRVFAEKRATDFAFVDGRVEGGKTEANQIFIFIYIYIYYYYYYYLKEGENLIVILLSRPMHSFALPDSL